MTTVHPADPVAEHEEIAGFVHRWATAIVANDVGRMADFVTDDWLLVDTVGTVTRESFHTAVASGVLHHTSMTHDVLEVRRLAADVAVVRTQSEAMEFLAEPHVGIFAVAGVGRLRSVRPGAPARRTTDELPSTQVALSPT